MGETIYVILKVLFDFALEVWYSILYSVHPIDLHHQNLNHMMYITHMP